MSSTKTSSEDQFVDSRKCPNCGTVLPLQASFCGTCGRRVEQSTQSFLQKDTSIHDRYRISSLIRRRPYVQILLATDTQYQRPVIIRAIDISSLHGQDYSRALEAIQAEYDQMRSQRIQDLMPLIDLRRFQDQVYTIAEWPFKLERRSQQRSIYTLDDLLQSGVGLPEETDAALWVERLALAIAHLHQQGIILGDLDPYAVIVSSDSYEGHPMLMVSWLPQVLRDLLPPVPAKAYTSYFYAPETHKGDIEGRSDVYSLGALLYLLLTGIAPVVTPEQNQQVPRPPRELSSRVSSGMDAFVMRTLATKPAERFTNAQEFAETLRDLITAPRTIQQPPRSRMGTVFKGKRDTMKLPAFKPSRQVSPYTTRKLPGLPAVLPQTPRPIHDLGPEDLVADPKRVKADQEATANVHIPAFEYHNVAGSQNEHTPAIEDIETVIIDASEFEAALAQATYQRFTPEEVLEPQTAEAAVAPEGTGVDGQPAEHAEEVATVAVPADEVATADAPPVEQDEATQTASVFTAEHTLIHINEPARQTEMPSAEEAQAEAEGKAVNEKERSLADVPTTPFKGQDQVVSETAEANQDEAVLWEEEEPAVLPTLVSPLGEEKTQESAIEDIATQPFTEVQQSNQLQPATMENNRTAVNAHAGIEQPEVQQDEAMLSEPPPARLGQLPPHTAPGTPSARQAASGEENLLQRLRHFILGQQQHNTSAAALIEAPLRIQPDQGYTMRIQVMGRNTPRQKGVGLSGLVQGDIVHIEVRSALYHNYAYIVQQADVQLPGQGFAAAVTIPMQPLSDGPSGRRERLHIFFMDEQRYPLYEKPFVIEVYVSPLVQSGREGHNVLPIPL